MSDTPPIPEIIAERENAAHPEDQCENCKGQNIEWFADNALWNQVVSGAFSILCPICFVTLAKIRGINKHWKLVTEDRERDLAAQAKEIAELKAKVFMLGTWKCDKCQFEQNNRVLNPETGECGVRAIEEVPVCPNDGEIMRRVTWQECAGLQRKGQR